MRIRVHLSIYILVCTISTGISISRTKLRRNQKSDPYLAFSDELVREVWYHMIKEVISGWKIIFSKDCVLHMTPCIYMAYINSIHVYSTVFMLYINV